MIDHHDVRSSCDLLSAWIESQMAYAGLPGLSIGVVHDQTVVWARGFGVADLDRRAPATEHTLYRIASITKLFTATAILQLRDAGRLRLDDPLVAHLPWFSMKSEYPDSPAITVRHLLTHTSGLPREAPFPYWTDGRFPDREAVRSGLAEQSQALAAETRWKYSNLALALAGEVVAAVSGQAYAEYVKTRILEPLGMTSTLVAAPVPDHPHFASGYARRLPDGTRSRAPWADTNGITPAANMTTSVRDLARFAMFHLAGTVASKAVDGATAPAHAVAAHGGIHVLKLSTRREMQRVHWLEPDWTAGWGLGFHIQRLHGKTYVGHGGSLRGYRTEMRLCPADGIGVIVLTNADDGEPAKFIEKAYEWVAPALTRATTPAPAVTSREPDPVWSRYVGRYRSGFADTQVLVHEGRLVLIGPALPDPMPISSRLIPTGEHTFVVDTDNGYGIHGERVVFEMSASGRVVRVKLGENYAEPVDHW